MVYLVFLPYSMWCTMQSRSQDIETVCFNHYGDILALFMFCMDFRIMNIGTPNLM